MGIFGRKRGVAQRLAEYYQGSDRSAEDDEPQPEPLEAPDGPYDVTDAPDDDIGRIDLGSVRVPVPEGAQVQVEMDPSSGSVKAVHIVVEQGRVTVSAYAAPRSGGLWRDVSAKLTEQLRSDGAKVTSGAGEWGNELSAVTDDVALRFVGVDGPGWLVRGVIAGPQSQSATAPDALREIVRGTVVNRGGSPMPVGTPLPITLPESVSEHIAAQQSPEQPQQES